MQAIERPWWVRPSEARAETHEERLGEIFARLADDDLDAMTELYDGWSDELFGFATWVSGDREAAAGIVQEVFLKLWRLRRRLARVQRARPYLLRMVRNAAADRYRAAPRRSEALEDDLLEPVHPDPTRSIAARRASAALGDLPEPQRTAIYLRLYSELSFRRIGEVTGVSTHTAASRFRLGIEKLRRRLGEDG